MTDPRQITDLPVATTIGDSDLFLLHQGVLDKQVTAAIVLGGCLKVSANLSDLASAGTARTNLGVPAISDVPYLVNNLSDLPNKATARANLSLTVGTNVQAWAAQLDAIAANNSTAGFHAQTGTNTVASRTLAAPANGFSITNPAGIAGNPTFALTNDLSAVEGLAGTGLTVRTATDTWTVRALTQPAAGITVSNGDGVSGNPTLALANDLSALEGLSSTGIAVRSTTDTWVQRSIAGTTDQIVAANADGVAGNPTFSLPAQIILPSAATAGSVAMREASGNGTNKVTIEAADNIASDFKLKLLAALPASNKPLYLDASGNVTTQEVSMVYLGALWNGTGMSSTTILTGSYSHYELIINKQIVAGTVQKKIYIQFYVSGAWVTSGYIYALNGVNTSSGAAVTGNSSSDSGIVLSRQTTSGYASVIHANLTISAGVSSATVGITGTMVTSDDALWGGTVCGYKSKITSATLEGIRIIDDAGTNVAANSGTSGVYIWGRPYS